MSSATGALKKQSEIGDNEEQQSARRLPAAATAGWQIIARETVTPFFFFAFLLAREGIAVWRSSLPILNNFGKRYRTGALSKARRHVAFY